MPKRACIKIAVDLTPEDLAQLALEGVSTADGVLRWAAGKLYDKSDEVAEQPIILITNMSFHVDYHIQGQGEEAAPPAPVVTRWQLLSDDL